MHQRRIHMVFYKEKSLKSTGLPWRNQWACRHREVGITFHREVGITFHRKAFKRFYHWSSFVSSAHLLKQLIQWVKVVKLKKDKKAPPMKLQRSLCWDLSCLTWATRTHCKPSQVLDIRREYCKNLEKARSHRNFWSIQPSVSGTYENAVSDQPAVKEQLNCG